MRFLVRVDGDTSIGGGHVMRCLTFAHEAKKRGHIVEFLIADGLSSMSKRIISLGFPVHRIIPDGSNFPRIWGPIHEKWLSTSWEIDAQRTVDVASGFEPDWIVWDHYGLDARWVDAVRAQCPAVKFLAVDDLDDRQINSELVLDQTRMSKVSRKHTANASLTGPSFALLRPEFALKKETALKRRKGKVRRILIAPGMVDGSGLAPLALRALSDFPNVDFEVVMGSASQTVAEVRDLLKSRPNGKLTLDSTDMASQMSQADLCIGAGGMTSWERCCLGLPTIAIQTAENQRAVLDALDHEGAIISMSLDLAREQSQMKAALLQAFSKNHQMSLASAALCDGLGATRVLDALEAELRPMHETDAKMLFDWRNKPRIRQASLNSSKLVWENHLEWIAKTLVSQIGIWKIYSEGGRDLGHVNATLDPKNGTRNSWVWGFYIGADNAPRGAGRRMLSQFLGEMFARSDVETINAEVRADNAASILLHKGFGFRQVASENPQVLAFILDRCNVNLVGGNPVDK